MQHRVLPTCAMERADFVQALSPLCGSSAPPSRQAEAAACAPPEPPKEQPPKPRKDYSKFLGSIKPNFTMADLEDMPESTLRTLCMKFGVLPPGEEVPRERLILALSALAPNYLKPRAATSGVLRVDDMLDEDE